MSQKKEGNLGITCYRKNISAKNYQIWIQNVRARSKNIFLVL
jgi:hypothetical protein